MIRNNIKTVLFASLIAAMILPFSAMDTAVAEEGKTDKQINKRLAEEKKSLEEALRAAHTDEEKNKIKTELEKLDLIYKILNLETSNTRDTAQTQKDLVQKLQSLYDVEEKSQTKQQNLSAKGLSISSWSLLL